MIPASIACLSSARLLGIHGVSCQALRKKKVPVEPHIYEKGAHGVGLGVDRGAVSAWPEQLAGWLKTRGLLTPEKD